MSSKKAAIITMHSIQNYGSQLQTFATQQKFLEYFDDVEIIDYCRSDSYGKGLTRRYAQGSFLRWLFFKPTQLKWHFVFRKFQKKKLYLSKDMYKKQHDFVTHPIRADVFVAGSDQIWNTSWNGGIVEPYYLTFTDSKNKYSFASSFGMPKLSKNEAEITRSLIHDYRKISVRERSAKDIVEKQLGLKCSLILDPTIAYDGDYWRKLTRDKAPKKDYILVYNLAHNDSFEKYVKKAAAKTGLPIYRLCGRYDQMRDYGKSIVVPKVEDFISYIDGAKYIITDSFHATAFAINLNKNVVPIYPKRFSCRISDFLSFVKQESCHPANMNDFSQFSHDMDFSETNKILTKARRDIDNYVKTIYEDVAHE